MNALFCASVEVIPLLLFSKASSKASTSIFPMDSISLIKKSSGVVSDGWSMLIAIIAAIVDETFLTFLSL